MTQRSKYRTGEEIPQSGIYRIDHLRHRLPHEVTLLRDEKFPRCAKCKDAVTFTLLRGVFEDPNDQVRIVLYELPVLGDEAEALAV